MLNGATGEVISELPFVKFYRFLRSRLRALMAEGVDVVYGKKLSSLSYADDRSFVTAHFDDGTSEKGRLVVGADGSNSKVRRLLVGEERAKLKQLPLNATFINASFPREQALFLRAYHPLVTVMAHPGNMMSMLALLDAPDRDKPEGWRFTFYISWQSPVEAQEAEAAVMGVRERLRQAKERSEAFADPLRSAHTWLPDDHEAVYWTRNMNWDPSLPEHAWDSHSGLVTLAGDAAHAMTYRKFLPKRR
jgi:2-polyprenyl-6-methoxyphenol hydroxylase-like FAD-dependent oxidoreductase